MGDVTEEELVQIATNFLLSSPPGEFMDVVTDVRALIPNEQLLNNHAAETFRDYNTEQMIQVISPASSKHQVLITKHGEVGDSEYLDPRGNKVVAFDHIRQEVTSSRAIGNELDSDVEPYRAAFDDEAVKYVNEHYPNGATTVYGKRKGNQYQVIVCISSSKFNPGNYWNGRWRSTWTVTFSPSGGQATVDGKLQVNVHYYEEGNVQLNNTVEKHLQSAGGDPSATAANALKAIIKAEQSFHSALDASYTTMGDTTFKALRRALPITRMKIDWNKIRTYKLGSELKAQEDDGVTEYLYKILVVGDIGTGKTSIIKRFVHNIFSMHYKSTIGVDFALKVINWDPKTEVRLQLWDIAGQERFGNMTRVYYKEAVGAMIVFDVTRISTFEAVAKWKADIDAKVTYGPDDKPIPVVLLANKCDLAKEGGYVKNATEMDKYVSENGFIKWFETSAKDNVNIDKAAKFLVQHILENDIRRKQPAQDVIRPGQPHTGPGGTEKKEESGCCK